MLKEYQSKYRVRAEQFNSDNVSESYRQCKKYHLFNNSRCSFNLHTATGEIQEVHDGDWIVTNDRDQHRVLSDKEFNDWYKLVDKSSNDSIVNTMYAILHSDKDDFTKLVMIIGLYELDKQGFFKKGDK